VVLQDFLNFLVQPGPEIMGSCHLPALPVTPIEQPGMPDITEMIQGMLVGDITAPGTLLFNGFQGQCFLINGNALEETFHEIDDFITHDNAFP